MYLILVHVIGVPLSAQDLVFDQQAAPFAVLDADGLPYALPFLGGLDAPRPQLIDLDADGDLDLFLQRSSGPLAYFENTGTPQSALFTWRTDAFQDLDPGLWYRFGDLDGDADYDLLGATDNQFLFGLLRVFLNTGTPQNPVFGPGSAPLQRTGSGDPIAAGLNPPSLADIDCDGDEDLFYTTSDGRISFFTHDGLDADGLPRYTFVTDALQDIVIVSVGKTAARHGIGTIRFYDEDGDGDLDMFWADEFTAGLFFFENTGSCAAPFFAVPNLEADFLRYPLNAPLNTSGFNLPEWGDLDADGDADLLVGVQAGFAGMLGTDRLRNLYFYTQAAPGTYTLQTMHLLSGIDLGEDAAPALADLDGDGDLDLLVGNKQSYAAFPFQAHIAHFENTGTATAPAFALRQPDAVPLPENTFNAAPALADLDVDGDPDLIVGGFQGALRLYRNTGTPAQPTFTLDPDALADLNVGNLSAPTLGDLDADGDLDLLVGKNQGTLSYFENTGTPAGFTFTLVSDAYLNIDLGERSTPALADLDEDGDLDLIVGATDSLAVYRNTGTPQAANFVPDPAPVPFAPQSHPTLADVNQDRLPDLLMGTRYGGLIFAQNLTEVASATEAVLPGAASHLETYPNPFGSHLQMNYRIPPGQTGRLKVYTLLGQHLQSWPLSRPNGSIRWDLHPDRTWADGVLLVTLEIAGQTVQTRLVVHRR